MLSVGSLVPETEVAGLVAKGEVYAKAHTKLGYVAQGVGDRDLKLVGVANLKAIEAKGKVPFVTANLVDKDGKPVFAPYVVVERQGFKFAILGLMTGTATLNETSFQSEQGQYKIEPPLEAAKKYMPEIQKLNPTAILLLAHMERNELDQLVKEVPGIDLILAGQGMSKSNYLEQIGDTYFVEGAQRGQVMNVLVMHLSTPQHKPFVVREVAEKLQAEVTRIDGQLERYAKAVNGPDRATGRGPSAKERFKKMIEDLLVQRAGLAEKAKTLVAPTADSPFLALGSAEILAAWKDDADVLAWIEAYEKAFPQAAPVAHGAQVRPPLPPTKMPVDAKPAIPKIPRGVVKPLPKADIKVK